MNDVMGKYRLEMSAEEVVEAGGQDKVPTLFLNSAGKWNLGNEGESVKGTFTYEAGKVSLADEDEAEVAQVFVVQEGGLKLVEDTAESPTVWVKVVEEKP